jgi:predicted Zn-dependent protease
MNPEPAAPRQPLSPQAAAIAADLRERFGFLREIVADMERSVPYASALVRFGSGSSVILRDGEQQANRLDPQSGIVLTASTGHELEETASDDLDPSAVRAAAQALVERVRESSSEGLPALDIVPDGPPDADFATHVEVDPSGVPLAERIERFDAVRRRLRAAAPRAVEAVAVHRESAQVSVFANRMGLATQQVRRAVLVLQVFVSDGSQRQFDVISRAGTGGLERLDVTDAALAECAATAEALLDAKPPPAGEHAVVIDPMTSGIVAHESFGHGVETDMFLKGRARAAEYVGRRVGSDLVTIMDDPTVPGAYGSYFMDDEGQPATPTTIVRNGIFERGITDLYSATRLGIPRSANGRRESVQRKAYARMSNTYIGAGDRTPEELIAELDDGLELRQPLNGMEDPKGWGIQIWTLYAREIKHGRPTGVLYSPIAITGYVPDLLTAVTGVSSQVDFSAGTCGKGWKEFVPVASGGPALRTRCRIG